MSEPRVLVIGSGLGGLATAVILARNGHRVCVLEQQAVAGGCLQCFRRRGVKFETGMHFIGSADRGQTLHRLMRYLGIADHVPLSRLDAHGYDVIALGGQQYRFANGREAFIETLADCFPKQRDNLARYFSLVEQVAGASSLHSLRHAESDAAVNTRYMLQSVNGVIDSVISDPLLARVLVGNLPLYAAERDKTPFSVHAFITDFYNQSAFRIVGGSDTVARALIDQLQTLGGEVRTGCRATRIVCRDGRAVGVEVNGEELLPADIVISDAHPKRTLQLLDSSLLRPAFRRRIAAIPETVGGFSVYLHFKDGAMPYMNHNFYGYMGDTPWNCEIYTPAAWPKGFLYMHFCDEYHPQWARTGVILSYMQWHDVERWENTVTGRRGADYEDFKRRHAERLIDALDQLLPGTRSSILRYYTSTPLTYRDFTGTERGSMYGVAKDVAMSAAYRVSHKTRIPNVLLTGQNINSHGMLGVLVGSIVTCSELLSAETIYQQIIAADT